jgi:large subunit ribosomal protein L18
MAIHKSNKNIYVQFVDDLNGKTLLSVSSSVLKLKNAANVKASVSLGEAASKKALSVGIKQVVFDRGGYIYHGKVRAFADSARKAGLKF